MPKILIVEDDTNIARALQLRFRSAGYVTEIAEDVIQATQKAMSCHPDVVLADITMPGGNGFLVAERMQHSPEFYNIPFVFMSANMNPEYPEKAEALGAHGFFEKPLDTDALMNCINNVVSEQKARPD